MFPATPLALVLQMHRGPSNLDFLLHFPLDVNAEKRRRKKKKRRREEKKKRKRIKNSLQHRESAQQWPHGARGVLLPCVNERVCVCVYVLSVCA